MHVETSSDRFEQVETRQWTINWRDLKLIKKSLDEMSNYFRIFLVKGFFKYKATGFFGKMQKSSVSLLEKVI